MVWYIDILSKYSDREIIDSKDILKIKELENIGLIEYIPHKLTTLRGIQFNHVRLTKDGENYLKYNSSKKKNIFQKIFNIK